MNLAETQELFFRALRGEAPADDACFVGTSALSSTERLQIYARMFLDRQVDALASDFPKLRALVGEERFGALARDYALAQPSRHPDLGLLGRGFAEFCPQPLRDLAALEWARCEVFFAADCTPVGDLRLAPDVFPSARLTLIPALRLLDLAHDAAAAWARIEDGQPFGAIEAGACALLVWRTGFDVFHAQVPEAEARAVRLALSGEPLAAVCGAFDDAEAAFAALQSWLAEGLVAAVC